MKFETFKQLSEAEQEVFTWYRGVLVGARLGKLYRYLLYQVESFYVEIVYMMHENVIREMRAFDDTDRLEPYLPKIRVVFES